MSSSSSLSSASLRHSMLRAVAELAKTDIVSKTFWWPVPHMDGYSSFVESAPDLSTIFCKVLVADHCVASSPSAPSKTSKEGTDSALTTTTTSSSSSSSFAYSLLAFEDDLVNMLLNCACFHTQSTDWGSVAARFLAQNLGAILARNSLDTCRKFLNPVRATSSPTRMTTSFDNDDDDAVGSKRSEDDGATSVISMSLQAVGLQALQYLYSTFEVFSRIVGNAKLTSSSSIMTQIYNNENNQNNNNNNNNKNKKIILPPRSLQELFARVQEAWLHYSSVDEIARDLQLLICCVLSSRSIVSKQNNNNTNNNNNNAMSAGIVSQQDLTDVLELRLVHCHHAFKISFDRFKKDIGGANISSQPRLLDALTLHNCPMEKVLVERKLSDVNRARIEKFLAPGTASSSSSTPEQVWAILNAISGLLLTKDGEITEGILSFPNFSGDDDENGNRRYGNQDAAGASSHHHESPKFLYLLQYQLMSGQIPSSMEEILDESSNKNNHDTSSNKSNEKERDLIWRTVKGEVDAILNQIVARYGPDHQNSRRSEEFRKQLNTGIKDQIHTMIKDFLNRN